ncbi:MBL fold metallo-hydrolase [Jannaschia seohaensis]|uniref:L-ascorbate metabolism protein UlaG (Beta-lactamase superfamily) n=1 Tax=Jannaschia seohaensis TaxID=475081 RepID=A0A2Y9A304_9RHOB|nr:MBL fold metallo-hydrolase [Jannaschia seohaensis]PWJ22307.1 L-ascorbate metabolism protein UlaG (beta-lactamase superfamily) [Jannaschia seohaensis]SSA38585.1 L-ascorbate metabolism protein UlaG, beta-lactamase superfamily [Jannaschia seohaensis]
MLRLLACLLILPAAALAQDRRPSHCIAVAQAPGLDYVHKASYRAPLPDDYTVRLNYIDHAMFMLETPGGLRAVTDFVGFIGSTEAPDVVTMNRAHISHWDPDPDPEIDHVLRGWSDTVGEPAGHYLDLGEMLVRSVSTDIRSRFDGGVERNGNSIFVFEVGGLCIGHLGHLHHEPSPEQYAALGRLDVVMAPVDGGLTLDIETMIRVLTRLRSSVVIPMHWFGEGALQRFLTGMEGTFEIDRRDANHLEVSLATLPRQPTVVVLRPRYLVDPE